MIIMDLEYFNKYLIKVGSNKRYIKKTLEKVLLLTRTSPIDPNNIGFTKARAVCPISSMHINVFSSGRSVNAYTRQVNHF